MTAEDEQRYTAVAVILHWVMAVAFLAMLAGGLSMSYLDLDKSLLFKMFQWHKSLGVLLLLTFFLRLGWRLLHKPPAPPAFMPRLEALAAKTGHIALYICMIIVPLSGWATVSSSSSGLPTIVFGWFEWPHIPGIAGNKPVHEAAEEAHKLLAWFFGICIAGHIAAVIKHAVIDKHNLLPRIWLSCARCKKEPAP